MSPTTASRRTLTKGAVWAAPAIIASAAIPAYAASRPQYEIASSWSSTNTYIQGDCSAGQANYTSIALTTATPIGDHPAGFAVRAYNGTAETTTAHLSAFVFKAAFPAGIIKSFSVIGGDYVVSGPVTQDVLGKTADIFTFTYTGITSNTTIPEGASSPSWPNSQLQTQVNFDPNTCYPVMQNYAVQLTENFTTDNGYSEEVTSPWLITAVA